MYFADTHMHSTVSFDGEDSRFTMARASRDEAGLDVICFTDHYDIINAESQYCPHYDWTPARREHGQAQQLCVPDSFQILYGLELGNAPVDFAAAQRVLEEPGLDFVIGSIHNTSQELGGADYYYIDYRNDPGLASIHLADYFDSMLTLARWGNFDTLGHIPYPLRYMRDRDGQPLSLNDWSEQIDAILRAAAEQGKAIEVNTNRGLAPLADYVPLLYRFRELGGELVTVGADAHRKEDVGKGIKDAYQLLLDCGFPYVTVFQKRKPTLIKL